MAATATQSRSEATISRIIDAARALFIARPYADVTMDEIAAEAGVTKGGLYHHFTGKEQLYVSMMLDDFERKRVLFSRAVVSGGTARQRLELLTRDFLEQPYEEREMARLVRRDINTFTGDDRERLVSSYQQALPVQVESIIAGGIADGEIAPCDARILAWSFVALVEVVIGPYADSVFGSTQARLDHVLGLFFDGAANDGGTR